MIVSTTDAIEGRPIRKHIGIVSGEQAVVLKFKWGMEKYISEVQDTLLVARHDALKTLSARAKALRADAVVGVAFDWEFRDSGFLIVMAVGTAVVLA